MPACWVRYEPSLGISLQYFGEKIDDILMHLTPNISSVCAFGFTTVSVVTAERSQLLRVPLSCSDALLS